MLALIISNIGLHIHTSLAARALIAKESSQAPYLPCSSRQEVRLLKGSVELNNTSLASPINSIRNAWRAFRCH